MIDRRSNQHSQSVWRLPLRWRRGAGGLALLGLLVTAVGGTPVTAQAQTPTLVVTPDATGSLLSVDDLSPFHHTVSTVTDENLIEVPGSSTQLALWSEDDGAGSVVPHYAISLDGVTMKTVRPTSYVLRLRHGEADPLVAMPPVDAALTASATTHLYIVQFVTQPLEEFRTAITGLGGTVHHFLPNHSYLVMMSPAQRDAVALLPFVRWVGPFHPAYKLKEEIHDQIVTDATVAPRRYSIMLVERGVPAQDRVSAAINTMGGTIRGTAPLGFRIEATLSLDHVRQVVALDDVLFVDHRDPIQLDMPVVRRTGGANYVESVANYTGAGVRIEVMDSELDTVHPEWGPTPIIHGEIAPVDLPHGTSVYGILYAQGSDRPIVRGLLPDGEGIFAYIYGLDDRHQHIADLVDPTKHYRAVLQNNSWSTGDTTDYTSISAEMDDILLQTDIAVTQSQGNNGTSQSGPEAWAKNIISCGAVYHDYYDDPANPGSHEWCPQGAATCPSRGPAADGRIKPDLVFF